MRPVRRVFVCVMNSGTYGREAALGVRDYVREHSNWELQFDGASNHALSLKRVRQIARDWKADGILGQIVYGGMPRFIAQMGIPAVNISNSMRSTLPTIRVDNEAAGRVAAEYLLGRGLRHFAYFGRAGLLHSDLRGPSFSAEIERAHFACHSLIVSKSLSCSDRKIAAWLTSLPKPLGLLVHDVYDGRDLIDLCRRLQLRVPDDVAVLGGDNDEIECSLCTPSLSSVTVPHRKIGYEAARLMDSLLNGARAPAHAILIKPTGISARHSTDTLGVADTELASAIRYIQAHACDGIDVSNVVDHACESRRSLERRFLRELGRTPRSEILRVRLERAKMLLSESALKITDVSRQCGYGKHVRFARAFKQHTKMTPSEFRAQTRTGR